MVHKKNIKVSKYLYLILGMVVIFSLGFVYIAKIKESKEQEIKGRMMILTQNFAKILDAQKFKSLQNDLSDENNPNYKSLREVLLDLGEINKPIGIRWIYTMVLQNGDIVFSVDSIREDSPDHSPPGDIYTDASKDMVIAVNNAWTKGVSSITSPYVDRWGHFITTIVPVIDNTNKEVTSVLASDMDYQTSYVNEVRKAIRLPIVITIFSEIIFVILFFYINFILKDKRELLGKHIVLKQYVEHVPGVFFQFQIFPNGEIRMPFTSRRVWDIFEVHREDLKEDGKKIFSHIKKEDIEGVLSSIEESKKTLNEWVHEFRVDLSRGTRWLKGKSKPEKLSDGSILWYGYVTDITEQKEMEIEMKNRAEMIAKEMSELEVANLKLKENRESILNLMTDMAKTKKDLEADDQKMKAIISSMGEGLMIINRQYKVLLINPKILELFETDESNLVNQNLFNVLKFIKGGKELSVENWPMEQAFIENKIVVTSLEDDISIKTDKMHNSKAVTLSISPLGNEEKKEGDIKNLVLIIRDANKDKELDMAKSGFISTASHQLRTPLTTIRWYSEMLLSGSYGVLTEAQHDLVNEIHSGVNRLYQTINLLLGISRIESGKTGKDRVPIDLTAITSEVIKELTPGMIEKKLVYFSFSAQTDPIFVILDPVTLRQVILNLFANAIRYTNNKGTIEGRWLIDKEKNQVVYSVRDNGIGIPKSAQPKVFTKFFRADNAVSKSPDGTGLGLAFVKDIVNSWGGKVWFETEEGKGTTFYFTIPTYKV